ncbi:MAG: hypothetical protein ABUS56_04540, partial [Acidobacteriota bacterium]
MRRLRYSLVALLGVALASAAGYAQGPPAAQVTPVVERETVAAGTTARLALQIALPDGYHVQSNAPRDPALIATTLTIDAPAGVAVDEVVFPRAVDVRLAGSDQPLAVFEREFAVGV